MSCPLLSVVGTVVVVGPVELEDHDTTYRYLVIQENGGRLRDLTTVRAVPALSELVEQHVIGMFLFWETPRECRLWCVDRADGPRQVDFAALRAAITGKECPR